MENVATLTIVEKSDDGFSHFGDKDLNVQTLCGPGV